MRACLNLSLEYVMSSHEDKVGPTVSNLKNWTVSNLANQRTTATVDILEVFNWHTDVQ